ncbi:MAG: VanZ family protein [Candidatus Accumulibacter meliphilus]|jgi:uncharacterized membrane protein AbrB (regulator of aidB expression)
MPCLLPARLQQLRIASLVLLLVLVPGLFVLGAQPIAVGLVPVPWDKLAHLALCMLLAILIGLSGGLLRLHGGALLLLAFVLTVLVGMLDEAHQAFLPGRSSGWDDLLADAFGALLGVFALARLGLAGRAGS